MWATDDTALTAIDVHSGDGGPALMVDGDDFLHGNAGNDTLNGGGGADG